MFDHGHLRGFAKVTRDITEQRKAHEERVRLERAEEALRLRDEFLGEAKRSLNSILVSVRIHVESLKSVAEAVQGERSPDLSAKLTILEWGLDRLTKRTDEVLRIAADTAQRLVYETREPRK